MKYSSYLQKLSNNELIEELRWFSCDPYYLVQWEQTIEEIKNRLLKGDEENA